MQPRCIKAAPLHFTLTFKLFVLLRPKLFSFRLMIYNNASLFLIWRWKRERPVCTMLQHHPVRRCFPLQLIEHHVLFVFVCRFHYLAFSSGPLHFNFFGSLGLSLFEAFWDANVLACRGRDFWRSCCNVSFWGDVRRHKKKTEHAKSSTNIIFEVKRFSMPSPRSLKCSLRERNWSVLIGHVNFLLQFSSFVGTSVWLIDGTFLVHNEKK